MNYRLIGFIKDDSKLKYSISESEYNGLSSEYQGKYEPDEDGDSNQDDDEDLLDEIVGDTIAFVSEAILDDSQSDGGACPEETDEMGGGDFGGGGSNGDW